MAKSKSSYFLFGMILLSLALGIFVSYLLLFANALFISEIGTSQLPMAYLISGIGGLFITWLFNKYEKKWGFSKAATFFSVFIAVLIFLIWYAYVQNFYTYYVVFFSYAMYWISVNFTGLVFWKIPSNIFNLEENKKYNGIISSGEGISAIISYLSVPLLLSLDFFTRDKFLLISFFGILSFAGITFLLSRGIVAKAAPEKISETKDSGSSDQKKLIKEPYFKLIFLSVLLAVVIQLVIDFCLMEVSANRMSDPLELAKYFSFIFGGMRVIELLLKSFVSKFLIKEYGVFISLTTLIFALAFTTIVGISSYFAGYLGLILIVASLGKVFERSLYRSLHAPTINLLYQAYPMAKRSITQNYADGFGKTMGQFVAALLILGIGAIEDFEIKVLFTLILVLVVLVVWLIVSKKLIFFYRLELSNILKSLNASVKSTPNTVVADLKDVTNQVSQTSSLLDSVLVLQQKTDQLFALEKAYNSGDFNLAKSLSQEDSNALAMLAEGIISDLHTINSTQLSKYHEQLVALKEGNEKPSKLLELLDLLVHTTSIQKNVHFNFFSSQKKLKGVDFLYSSVIQHMVKMQVQDLRNQDYYLLLEERIQKYSYLLICHKDLGKSYPALDKLILSETKTAKNDILYCLSFKHDPVTLNQIVTMINQGDKSEELISLELLELILEEQEKKWILPIFKESNPDKILSKLERDFPQVVLGNEKRLLSLLSSFKLDIPGIIKAQALLALMRDFPSMSNKALFNSIQKNNPRLSQLTNKFEGERKVGNSTAVLDVDPVTNQELENEFAGQQTSSEVSSLHYCYWFNKSEVNEEGTSAQKGLYSVYKTLFPVVFPLEKLN
jgi:AAA family ATP:ADP antiporter